MDLEIWYKLLLLKPTNTIEEALAAKLAPPPPFSCYLDAVPRAIAVSPS
ncbi:MAG: hypothetical protein ACKPIF_10560 [Microcystis panniformis]|nr:hypothetical protein [Microcystis aeruginosa]